MMKKLTKLSWTLLLFGCLMLNSCEKISDPFSGGDNYITSFILKSGDRQIRALIEDDKITITPSSGFLLDDATADIILSENAKIKPNPATITNWNSEQVFIVTAPNGETKSYHYSVSDSGNSSAESVVLATQAEVDAFGQSGITVVAGSLIIGTATGRDSITSLVPLNKLKEISYNLIVKSTYANNTLDGFSSLKKIGRSLRIEESRLTEARLPALESAMNVEIASTALAKLECPKLALITGSMDFSLVRLKTIAMPTLETVNGNIFFTGRENNAVSDLEDIVFPALKEIGGKFQFGNLSSLKNISLPELVNCGQIFLGYNSVSKNLTAVSMPKLEECKGELRYHQLTAITDVNLPSLKHAGSLIVYDCDAETFNLPNLTKIDGDLTLNGLGNLAPEGLNGFKTLAEVGGAVYISYSIKTSVKTLTLPPMLQNYNSLRLLDCATLETIDLTGLYIKELFLERSTLINLTIKGDNIFKGKITVNGDGSSIIKSSYNYAFPKFEGIKEIEGLTLTSLSYMRDVHIAGINKINGDFKIIDNSLNSLTISDLTEISGDLYTGSCSSFIEQTVKFATIKKIGGYISVYTRGNLYSSFNKEILSFPDLETAGGISMSVNATVKDIQTPKLTGITDSLSIYCMENIGENNELTNLDGFSNLKSVHTIHIEAMQALVSYEGLKNCIDGLMSNEQWNLIYNKYEPSLADMKAGKWNQN